MCHLSKRIKLWPWAMAALTAMALACSPLAIHRPDPTPVAVWSSLSLASREDILDVGEKREWNFDISSGEMVLLSLEAHIGWYRLAGSAPVMDLLVNDKPVTGKSLVNKPITFTYADARSFSYYQGSKPELPPYWVLSYSPDYESNNMPGSNYQVLEGQACLYIFDITGLVDYGQSNKVVLINRGERARDEVDQSIPLVFRQVKLLTRSKD